MCTYMYTRMCAKHVHEHSCTWQPRPTLKGICSFWGPASQTLYKNPSLYQMCLLASQKQCAKPFEPKPACFTVCVQGLGGVTRL